ncbi:MAG: SCP2 sterol-binding domain-containing protein [Deltaproteobacteria bacterium]|nr:SCP2 sterol-binding domain-containing protein [Deltaproteobacteria bacterium]
MGLREHPGVLEFQARQARGEVPQPPEVLDAAWLKDLARAAGADDVGLADLAGPELAAERPHILAVFPATRALVSLVSRLNPGNVRCPTRAVADREFLAGMEAADAAARSLARRLGAAGVGSLAFPAGFPMDMAAWPGRMWAVSHKLVAQAAGLGRLGLNRCLLHPRFGSLVVLATVLVDRPATAYDPPLDHNPCLDCKLCVAVCPVGALAADGHFAFTNCLTHNYRDRLGGFSDWAENLVEAKNRADYRRRVPDPETTSMWQSLSYGVCNKSSYCLAVCPAGQEQMGPFLADRAAYTAQVARPFQEHRESVYVVAGSDAEEHVVRRFPHKTLRRVGNGVRPASLAGFLTSLPLAFQRGRARDLAATYHLSFSGEENAAVTVRIDHGQLTVAQGLEGRADLSLKADSRTWVNFLRKEQSLVGALVRGKLRIKGDPRLLKAFAACFAN